MKKLRCTTLLAVCLTAGICLAGNDGRLGRSTLTAHGMRESLADSIDSIVGRAIADGAMPGCQVLVARGGDVVFERAYGNLTAGGQPVTRQSVYDLASVSKAIGTLPGIMVAVDSGYIDLDAPVSKYIPGMRRADKADITVRQLLTHESGMQSGLNMHLMLDTARCLRRDVTSAERTAEFPTAAADGIWVGLVTVDTIMARIYASPLRPDKSYNYSCLNFCLLLDAEQRATGRDHQAWVDSALWRKLGMTTMCYRPREHHPLSQIAPTEADKWLRHQTVHGYVHDELAAMQGGVSGNAGLFANAMDVARMCQMWLQDGRYGDTQVISPAVTREFTTYKSPTCRRGLGFDKPDTANPQASPTCAEASPAAFGHLGFTGTCFWVDPEQELIFVFLTNRVNPTRENAAFAKANLRPKLFSQVYKAIKD